MGAMFALGCDTETRAWNKKDAMKTYGFIASFSIVLRIAVRIQRRCLRQTADIHLVVCPGQEAEIDEVEHTIEESLTRFELQHDDVV
jgi:hypothetical protein